MELIYLENEESLEREFEYSAEEAIHLLVANSPVFYVEDGMLMLSNRGKEVMNRLKGTDIIRSFVVDYMNTFNEKVKMKPVIINGEPYCNMKYYTYNTRYYNNDIKSNNPSVFLNFDAYYMGIISEVLENQNNRRLLVRMHIFATRVIEIDYYMDNVLMANSELTKLIYDLGHPELITNVDEFEYSKLINMRFAARMTQRKERYPNQYTIYIKDIKPEFYVKY